jgi:pilus assembly protein CpaE
VPCSSGAGATTLAISAAAHLANRRGGQKRTDTCLVDLDFAFGACGQYLDAVNDYNLDGVLRDPERMDLELLDIVERGHKSGFSLLSFYRPRVPLIQIGEDFVLRLLDVVSYRYPHVVIDMPPYPTDWTDQVLRDCDRIVLVTELTVPGLKYGRDAYRHLIDLRNGAKGLYVVVNKTGRRWFSVGVRPKEASNIFKKGYVRFLPEERKVMSEALNRGVPAREVNRRSKLMRRLDSLLDEILTKARA